MKKFLCLSLLPSLGVASEASPGYADSSSLIMFGVVFGLMYFMVIRPQNKKAREQKQLIDKIQVNDEVITNAGIVGKVIKIKKDIIIIDTQGSNIMIQKQAIATCLQQGTIASMQ